MDGITIAGVIVAASIPTWAALYKIHYKMGQHDVKLETHGNRLNSIEKKLDTLNGNIKNRA